MKKTNYSTSIGQQDVAQSDSRVAKTNAALILKQAGIDDVKSL